MKEKYKNPFEDPEAKLWDKKVKDYKIPKRKEAPLEKKATEYPEIEGYVYVPTIGLYVAKEVSFCSLDWYGANLGLHRKGLQMLTIRQFIDFMLYLKQNPGIPDLKKLLDEILTESEYESVEWLDARFTEELRMPKIDAKFSRIRGKLHINYNHKTKNGNLVAKSIEPLEKCLMEGRDIDLKRCNKQGLPTKVGYDMQYWFPAKDSAAGFKADSGGFGLHCHIEPRYSHFPVCVRAALKLKKK